MIGEISSLFTQTRELLLVLLVAATPILELRGSIPLGLSLNLTWKKVYILSVIGNIIPAPLVIIFMRPVFSFFKKTKFLNKIIHWLEDRAMKKAETVMKYSAIGLFLLVAIPLPGTGAWTGSMVAALLDMRIKYAMPAIILGVIVAGLLVMGISNAF